MIDTMIDIDQIVQVIIIISITAFIIFMIFVMGGSVATKSGRDGVRRDDRQEKSMLDPVEQQGSKDGGQGNRYRSRGDQVDGDK